LTFRDLTENPLFRSRIQETATWCAERLNEENPAGGLRTDSLKPQLVNLEGQEGENQGSWSYDTPNPKLEVEDLCRKRAAMLNRYSTPKHRDDVLFGGRLLLFYPQETLCDGAAWQGSKGFFDYWNIPAWDTWIWCTDSPVEGQILYSWIPPQFIELASYGVSANPEECLCWL
jgi:hypothetical protein